MRELAFVEFVLRSQDTRAVSMNAFSVVLGDFIHQTSNWCSQIASKCVKQGTCPSLSLFEFSARSFVYTTTDAEGQRLAFLSTELDGWCGGSWHNWSVHRVETLLVCILPQFTFQSQFFLIVQDPWQMDGVCCKFVRGRW
jgi:hypothetical protein